MTTPTRAAEGLTREIRACFNRLRALGERLHGDLAVTPAMRAVLETLDEEGERTVAQIARAKSVSRQHIQALTNALVASGLVETRPNPADRRAPLVGPTAAGRATFARMREREAAAFADLGSALAGLDVGGATAVLCALRVHLDRLLDGEPIAPEEGPDGSA